MKKAFVLFLSILFTVVTLTGCGGVTGATSATDTLAAASSSGIAATSTPVQATPEATKTVAPTPAATSEVAASPTPADSGEAQTSSSATADSALAPNAATNAAVVYMTKDISPKGLQAVYQSLGATVTGKVAVKLSTGEPPSSNYLKPELIKNLVQSLKATIVECNTAYGGQRANTAMHLQVAKDHGYTAIADVDIMDSKGEISLPVDGGEMLKENIVGANFKNYDYFVVLSHFKGHEMAGYGGALKNISIGIASSAGKCWIHTGGKSKTSMWGGDQDSFLKSMAEAGKSVVDSLDGKILYINVMNRLSIDCDCNGNPAEPDMHDVGILASLDPVALDQACIDLVSADPDGKSLMDRIQAKNGLLTLEHASALGLGSRTYNLVHVDD